jgi:hypothetical protein
MWMDYGAPAPVRDITAYADAVARIALGAYNAITYHEDVPLAMAEATLTLGRRLPDDRRQEWAERTRQAIEGDAPKSVPEVYALEQAHLLDSPERELKLQAIRIGDLGITAMPNEVYGLTGLKIKASSPLPTTVNIELANGAEGYIPPPEQHALGGYTTWPARTAALEVQAEPRIVDTVLGLLERVSGQSRRPPRPQGGTYAEAVIASKPTSFFRLDEMQGTTAADLLGGPPARFEPGIALALPGPDAPAFTASGDGPNRAIHCAGGRLLSGPIAPGDSYSLVFTFWNGLPHDARPVTGYLASIGPEGDPDAAVDHLGIGGTHPDVPPGRLFVFNGNLADAIQAGRTELPIKQWCQVVLVRDGPRVRVYLDGNPEPEIDAKLTDTRHASASWIVFGGRVDGIAGLEGKIDEVAVYDRALSVEEISSISRAASTDRTP